MPQTQAVTALELWIIGPTPIRQKAEQAIERAYGESFTPVFHPTHGHEAASVMFDRDFAMTPAIMNILASLPGLSWIIASCTQRGEFSELGCEGHVDHWVCRQDGHVASSSGGALVTLPQPNDLYTLMPLLAEHWLPGALRKVASVPFPSGTALQQAVWRDDGQAVARLLADRKSAPPVDDAAGWWEGLAAAIRRPAHLLIFPKTDSVSLLDGRNDQWSRSAADAWLEAFPLSLRDLSRACAMMDQADTPCIAGLTHWGIPAHVLYKGTDFLDEVGLPFRDEIEDPWLAFGLKRPQALKLSLPERQGDISRAELLCHDRLLAHMVPQERERLLNGWLTVVSDRNHYTAEILQNDILPLLNRWQSQGFLPAAWFTAKTMDWANTTRINGRADARWLEVEVLKATMEREGIVPQPSAPRSRL